jgi:hypothetical protein
MFFFFKFRLTLFKNLEISASESHSQSTRRSLEAWHVNHFPVAVSACSALCVQLREAITKFCCLKYTASQCVDMFLYAPAMYKFDFQVRWVQDENMRGEKIRIEMRTSLFSIRSIFSTIITIIDTIHFSYIIYKLCLLILRNVGHQKS